MDADMAVVVEVSGPAITVKAGVVEAVVIAAAVDARLRHVEVVEEVDTGVVASTMEVALEDHRVETTEEATAAVAEEVAVAKIGGTTKGGPPLCCMIE